MRLSFQRGEVGTFILSDTLEHVADPLRAMQEVQHCLRPGGVAIYSSVMNFPIHGYPNDYWRIHARSLPRPRGRFFPCHDLFLRAERISSHRLWSGGEWRLPVGCAADSGRTRDEDPHHRALIVEARAARVIRNLTSKLLPAAVPPRANARAGLDRFAQPGWHLVTGQWLTGWTTVEG